MDFFFVPCALGKYPYAEILSLPQGLIVDSLREILAIWDNFRSGAWRASERDRIHEEERGGGVRVCLGLYIYIYIHLKVIVVW